MTLEYPEAEMQGPPFSVGEAEVRQLYEPRYQVAPLYAQDVLAENVHLRKRGLSALTERVYRLTPSGKC